MGFDSEDVSLDDRSSRRSRGRFGLLLEAGSLALFAIFLVRLLPLFFEMAPLNLAWQGDFVSVLVEQGLLPFLGFVFLHLAVALQPRQERMRRRLRLVRQLAVIAVLGYVLLVPLQMWSSSRQLSEAKEIKVKYFQQDARLSELRNSMLQAQSLQDLDIRLQSLLEPALTPDQLNTPLPQLRNQLLRRLDMRQSEISRLLKSNSDEMEPLGLVISRVATAICWALAFAAGAVPWGSRSTLLERLRGR